MLVVILLSVVSVFHGCNSSLEEATKKADSNPLSMVGVERYNDFKNVVITYLVKSQYEPDSDIRSEFSSDFDKAYAVAVTDERLRTSFFDIIADIHSLLTNGNQHVRLGIGQLVMGNGTPKQAIKRVLVLGFMTSIAILRNVYDLQRKAANMSSSSSRFQTNVMASFYWEMANRSFKSQYLKVLFHLWMNSFDNCCKMCSEIKPPANGNIDDKIDSGGAMVESNIQECRRTCVRSILSAYTMSGLYYDYTNYEFQSGGDPFFQVSTVIFSMPEDCGNDLAQQDALKRRLDRIYKISSFYSKQFSSLQEIRTWIKEMSADLQAGLKNFDTCLWKW